MKQNKQQQEMDRPLEFLDCIAPSIIRFQTDHCILGCSYRCYWALKEYPTSTDEQAILRHLGKHSGITLHIYARPVSFSEERVILNNAANRNHMNRTANDVKQSVLAEENLRDMAVVSSQREPLFYCAVYLELAAPTLEELHFLQNEVQSELVRGKLNVDRLLMQQQSGFLCTNPAGHNAFGRTFERVLPVSSVANLFPNDYSGKVDPHGFYLGRDRYGGNVIVDFDRRTDDITNASILILGNSGQGKSYLINDLLCILLESGKSIIAMDSEHELVTLCDRLGGCFIDLFNGNYSINLMEPRCWDTEPEATVDPDTPQAFRSSSILTQHISFLRDVFRRYREFDDRQLDVLELMAERLYRKWRITDDTDFTRMTPMQHPTLTDFYNTIEDAYRNYDQEEMPLYPQSILQDLLLGIRAMCKVRFFNGYTNITSSRFLVFGVKDLEHIAKNLRDTFLLNIFSYMSDKILTAGNTVAVLDELYLWLDNPVAITYIRNSLKRVRKRDSALIMASQNLEDFDQPGVRELTRPLFSIPQHQFIFNAGTVDKSFYMDLLQLEESEFEHIRSPQRGVCLYKCGHERFLLEVDVPKHRAELFGTAGGR